MENALAALLAGDYRQVRFDGELQALQPVLLECVPETVDPEAYAHLLPDARVYAAWYCRRARQIEAATGSAARALKLLELGVRDTAEVHPHAAQLEALADSMRCYEKTVRCVFRAAGAVPAVLRGREDLGERLLDCARRVTFAQFEQDGACLEWLFGRLADVPAAHAWLAQILFDDDIGFGIGACAGLVRRSAGSAGPAETQLSLAPELLARIAQTERRSLEAEIDDLSQGAATPAAKTRLTHLLGVITRRREVQGSPETPISWSELREMQHYAELADAARLPHLEERCVAQLERLSTLLN